MAIELTFGGPKAWAYQQLSSNLTHKLNIIVGTKPRKTFLLTNPRSKRNVKAYIIVDEKFIYNEHMEFLAKCIKGLGKQKAMDLLLMFGSVDNIRKADIPELRKIKGIGNKLASRIKQAL